MIPQERRTNAMVEDNLQAMKRLDRYDVMYFGRYVLNCVGIRRLFQRYQGKAKPRTMDRREPCQTGMASGWQELVYLSPAHADRRLAFGNWLETRDE